MTVAWLLAAPTGPLNADENTATLADRLGDIADRQGFTIKGLKRLETVQVPDQGTGPDAVRRLLKNYDYVMELAGPDSIRKLIILGKKRPAPAQPTKPDEITLETNRQGEHHFVNVSLQGYEGQTLAMELMVDTGASLVVLPASSAGELGLETDQLEQKTLQTAKGELTARVGRIKGIQLGDTQVTDVEVALVDDESLGGMALLGMNVLSRYLFILDDEKNQLILVPQEE